MSVKDLSQNSVSSDLASEIIHTKTLLRSSSVTSQEIVPKLKLSSISNDVKLRHRKTQSLSISTDIPKILPKHSSLNNSICSSKHSAYISAFNNLDSKSFIDDTEKLEKQIKSDIALESKLNHLESKRIKDMQITVKKKEFKENFEFYRQQNLQFQALKEKKEKLKKLEERKYKMEKYREEKIAKFEEKIRNEIEAKNELERQREWSSKQKELLENKKKQEKEEKREQRRSQLEFWNCQKRMQWDEYIKERNDLSFVSNSVNFEEKWISTKQKSTEVRSRLERTLKLLNM
ncbi:unnamed protein product [Blepharisma stoltei]|uniref:Uncharacterized protein n=1 Tax=Blepharisma stoltei TaxID=1481888 RepID=A0AAU9JQL0_9CILI|nr:unnamed protein product [Blepharisma stoltei]